MYILARVTGALVRRTHLFHCHIHLFGNGANAATDGSARGLVGGVPVANQPSRMRNGFNHISLT